MRRGQLVVGSLAMAFVLAMTAFLTRGLYSTPSDTQDWVEPTSELEWNIHDATRTALPANGYTLMFQESQKCKGAAVIKYTGEDWELGLAWYDKQSEGLTDVVKRSELSELIGRYIDVDPAGLKIVRHAPEDMTPEMFVGTISTSAESVWLQLDPDSCSVRSGWLVYRKLPSGSVTRQKISW